MSDADKLIKTLNEIRQRWMYNIIHPNVNHKGQRRRDDVPWNGLIVIGDLGPAEGHECFMHTPEEGCFDEGHDNYQFVGWIDLDGNPHYVPDAGG